MNAHNDIAAGNWISRWPTSLRWILFFPLALAGSILLSIIFLLIVSLGTDIDTGSLNGGWYRLVQSALVGGLFVYIGAYVAPKLQFAIGVSMLVIVTLLLTFIFTLSMVNGSENWWYLFLHLIAGLAGGGVSLYAIYDETTKYNGDAQWKK